MNSTGLNWAKLDWKDFQKVSLFLYREDHEDNAIEEYLRQGHFQAGIDLLSFQQSSGKQVCIQCKHSQLTLAKLKAALSLFLSGEFAATTETFIITTSADLQAPAIQTWITAQKMALREHQGIAFDVWDRQRLNDRLAWHYRLVEKYFGLTDAVENCFKPAFAPPSLLPVPGFINRNIQPVQEDLSETHLLIKETPRSTLTLTDLLAAPGENKCVCLVAEAYEGKSSLFRQTAWELGQLDLGLVPLVLDLKFCSVLPVTQLLDTQFGTWRDVPAKNLAVLIDGLDEVPAEQFFTVAAYIRDFQTAHPAIAIAVSCRRVFYKYQNLASTLKGFGFYELLELNMRAVFDYLDPVLAGRENAMAFYQEINGLGIADLLGTPFYLIHLTAWFTHPAVAMPKSKIAIASRFVDESLQVSATRKLRAGLSLDKYRVKYRRVLEQLALLLQIRGLNACPEDELQELFAQEDIDLLTHSSLLNINGNQWSFINAVFQEQLAALALQKLDTATVIGLFTIGDKIKKVSKKWIQTVATYLSLLPENDTERDKVIEVIEADNIELLALSEGNKFSDAFRLEILQKILNRSMRYQARLVSIGESDLASFAGNQDAVVDELFMVLQSDTALVVKVVACRTLRYLRLSSAQAERYAIVAKAMLINEQNGDLGRLLLEALAHYRHGDEPFLSRLLTNPALQRSHEFRQGFYQYLAAHGLADRFYDWLLNGFELLRLHNTGTMHFGSEKRLLDLVLSTRDRKLITNLLETVKTDAFQQQFRDDKAGTKQFYATLAVVCAEIYGRDPLIIFPVTNYLVQTGRHHYDREPNEMVEFLSLTHTYALGLRIVLSSADKEGWQQYAFSGALHPECFDEICYAVESGEVDEGSFRVFCNGLYYSGRVADAQKLEHIGETLLGYVQRPDPKATAWQKAEERKRNNDLLFISSPAEFRQAVIRLFEIAGSPVIKTSTLHGKFDEDNLRNKIPSSYLTHFISLQAEEKTASLDLCLRAVDDDLYFRTWRAEQLFNGYLKRYFREEMLRLLKMYYDEEIVRFPFDQLQVKSPKNMLYQAGQLMKIWAEYQWPTDEATILEFSRINTEGYGGMQFRKVNKRKSITELLIQHFADRPQLLKDKVLQNLATDLQNYEVIGTQFEICRELKIREAVPYLLDAIKNKKSLTHHEDDFMSLYIDFGGDYAELLPIFESITALNDYLFMFMVKLLEPVYPTQVTDRLLACLRATGTDEGRKIEAAQRLAQLGNRDGFLYLVSKLEAGKAAPFDVQGKVSYWNVDTVWGLEQIQPLLFIILDEKSEAIRFHHSPKYLLLEILNGFAAKSEAELTLVTALMQGCALELETRYPKNSGHLLWHAEQMNERYRQINVVPLSNKEIKTLFQVINDN